MSPHVARKHAQDCPPESQPVAGSPLPAGASLFARCSDLASAQRSLSHAHGADCLCLMFCFNLQSFALPRRPCLPVVVSARPR